MLEQQENSSSSTSLSEADRRTASTVDVSLTDDNSGLASNQNNVPQLLPQQIITSNNYSSAYWWLITVLFTFVCIGNKQMTMIPANRLSGSNLLQAFPVQNIASLGNVQVFPAASIPAVTGVLPPETTLIGIISFQICYYYILNVLLL